MEHQKHDSNGATDENSRIARVPPRKVPRVCPTQYQADIPKLKRRLSISNNSHEPTRKEVKRQESDGFKAVFLRHKISQEEIDQYLKIVKQISSGINSSEEHGKVGKKGLITFHDIGLEEQALQFLHDMDYSLIKAKFYLIFPSFLAFNAQLQIFSYKPSQTLLLSDEEMQEKINQYMSFQNVSFNDEQEQWQNELESLIATRPPLSKLQYLLDLGKRKKFEVPANVKESLDSLSKISVLIKKMISERAEIDKLRELFAQSKTLVSQEMLLLEESLPRCEQWLNALPLQKPIQFKDLQQQVLDYRSLMLKSSDYSRLKEIYENCLDCLEKISITKKTRRDECASWSKTLELYNTIRELKVECEEFRTYQKKVLEYQQFQEMWAMALEDKQDNGWIHRILKEMNLFPWQTDQVLRVQALSDYHQKMERVLKNLRQFTKYEEIRTDLDFLNERFKSRDLTEITSIFKHLEKFYISLDQLQQDAINPTLIEILNLDSLNSILFDIEKFKSIYTPEVQQYIDKKSTEYIQSLFQKIQLWNQQLSEKSFFDQMLDHFYQGLQLKFLTTEIKELFEQLKQMIQWYFKLYMQYLRLCMANKLLLYYDKNFQTGIQIPQNCEMTSFGQLLESPKQALFQTNEYHLLKNLQRQTADYHVKVVMFLENQKITNEETYRLALDLYKQGIILISNAKLLGGNLPVEGDYLQKLHQRLQGYELKQEFAEINGKSQQENQSVALILNRNFNVNAFEEQLISVIEKNDVDELKGFIISKWKYIISLCRFLNDSKYDEDEKLMEERIQKFMQQSENIHELKEERQQAEFILEQYSEFKVLYDFVYYDRRAKQKKTKYLNQNVKSLFLLNQTAYTSSLCKLAITVVLLHRSYNSKLAYPQHSSLKALVTSTVKLIDFSPQTLNELQNVIIAFQKLNCFILPLKVLKNQYYYIQSFQQIVQNLANAMPQLKLKMEITAENCFVEFRDDLQAIVVQYKGQGAKLRRRRNWVLNTVYCICRQGHDGIQDMMQCDICDDWQFLTLFMEPMTFSCIIHYKFYINLQRYHNDCIAIKPSYCKKIPTYSCMACCLRLRTPYQIESDASDFKWHLYKKLTLVQFKNLYQQTLQIPIDIPEKQKILSLNQQIESFQLLAQKKLDQGINSQNIWPYDEAQAEIDSSILDLIKWGIYLPVETEIFPKLILLIQRRDYAKQMRRFLVPNQMTNHVIVQSIFNEQARSQFLKKENQYLKIWEEEELQSLLNKISSVYQMSIEQQKVLFQCEELTEFMKQRAESSLIRSVLLKISTNSLLVDNLDCIVKSFNEFLQWEQQVKQFLQPNQSKIGIQELYQFKTKYDGFICSNVGLYGQLMQEVLKVQEWMNSYLIWQQTEDKETALLLRQQARNLRVQLQQNEDLIRKLEAS